MKGSLQLWLGLGWVMLLAIGVFAEVKPRLDAIGRLNQEATSLRARAARADNGAAELARLRSQLQIARMIVQTETKPIPSRGDVAGLIRELTARLDEFGMTEREITTGSANLIEGVYSIPVSVRMKGSFLGVYASFDWLESMPRLVRILRVDIETPSQTLDERMSSTSSEVNGELLLDVYFDPDHLEKNAALVEGQEPKT